MLIYSYFCKHSFIFLFFFFNFPKPWYCGFVLINPLWFLDSVFINYLILKNRSTLIDFFIFRSVYFFGQLWNLIDQSKSVGHNRPKSVSWLCRPHDYRPPRLGRFLVITDQHRSSLTIDFCLFLAVYNYLINDLTV